MGNNANDTLLHCFWSCPANAEIENSAVQKTQYLVKAAEEKSITEACLWLRGLILKDWSQKALQDQCNLVKDDIHIVRNPKGGVPFWHGNYTIYGDASGGVFTKYPPLRRIGFRLRYAKGPEHIAE